MDICSISTHLVKSTDPGASLADFISHLHYLLGVCANHLSFLSFFIYKMGIIMVPTS